MLAEADIWRAAALLIDRYGSRAADEATKRADDMLAQGDMEGRAVWRRIRKAVCKLQQTEPIQPCLPLGHEETPDAFSSRC